MGKKIKVRDPIAPRSEMVKQMILGTKGTPMRDRRDRRAKDARRRKEEFGED